MKKVVFSIILTLFATKMGAQESQTGYNFLRLPVSAHAAALGGDNITLIEDDAALAFHNPALLASVNDRTLNFNYMNYMKGEYGISFIQPHRRREGFVGGIGAVCGLWQDEADR